MAAKASVTSVDHNFQVLLKAVWVQSMSMEMAICLGSSRHRDQKALITLQDLCVGPENPFGEEELQGRGPGGILWGACLRSEQSKGKRVW